VVAVRRPRPGKADGVSAPWMASSGRLGTMQTMFPLLAAKVWTYWISFFIIIPVVLLVIGIGIAYLIKVVSLKYPKQ
jgi:hypothetical protein